MVLGSTAGLSRQRTEQVMGGVGEVWSSQASLPIIIVSNTSTPMSLHKGVEWPRPVRIATLQEAPGATKRGQPIL